MYGSSQLTKNKADDSSSATTMDSTVTESRYYSYGIQYLKLFIIMQREKQIPFIMDNEIVKLCMSVVSNA